MNKEATTTITTVRYNELLESETILAALEAGGVDSWEGYEQSLEDAGL